MRKVLALFFVIALVTPLLVAALIVLPVRSWLFNREFYYDALSGEQVIKMLQGTTLPIPAGISLPISSEIVDAFFVSLTRIITPEYLDDQLHIFIDDGLEILEGKSNAININIDLVPLKEAIQGEKKTEFINTFAANFPTCENDEEPNLSQMLVICRPPSVSAETFAQNIIEPIFPQLINYLPDEYPIQLPIKLPAQKLFFWIPLFPNLSIPGFLTAGVTTIAFFALLFWMLVALIADPSWHVRLKWLGGSLIFPSLLVLLVSGLVYLQTNNNILMWVLNLIGVKITVGVISSMLTLIGQLAIKIAQSFLISGSISLGIAIALIAFGNINKPRQTEFEKIE